MATVNFLYRSTKEDAPLNLRLLFRLDDKDHVLGGKTQLQVSKHYWIKEHPQKRPKDIEISNRQLEVNTELNNIEKHILGVFNEANPKEVTKDWLVVQMDLYYNPPQQNVILPINLIEYIEFYIDYRKHEITPTTVIKYNVIKHKLERLQKKRKKPILIKDINEGFKKEFLDYQKSKGYAQNTIQRELTLK